VTDEKKLENEFGFGNDVDIEPVTPEEALRRYNLRRAMLDPSGHVQQRATGYTLAMGRVVLEGGPVVLRKQASAPFRARRIFVRAIVAPLPKWVSFLYATFHWACVPWLIVRWDDDVEANRIYPCLARPALSLRHWADRKAQRKALGTARITSIRVGNLSATTGDIPANAFVGQTVSLDMPTCSPDQFIEVTFEGQGGPFEVVLSGIALQ
jgi:hypothetical protein